MSATVKKKNDAIWEGTWEVFAGANGNNHFPRFDTKRLDLVMVQGKEVGKDGRTENTQRIKYQSGFLQEVQKRWQVG